MKDQAQEGVKAPAPYRSIQSGAAHNPGLDDPGEWALGPGLEHLARCPETRRRTGLDWSSRRAAEPGKRHRPGLERPGKIKRASRRASWTGETGRLRTEALNWIIRGRRRTAPNWNVRGGTRRWSRQQRTQERDPQGMKDHQGRTSRHGIILGKRGQKQGPSNTVSVEENEGQNKRGDRGPKGSAGRRRRAQQMKDQPEERAKAPATNCSIQGGSAHHPSLDHPGKWAQCPGTSRAGPGNKKAAPWTGATRGPWSQEEAQTPTGSSREDQEDKQEGSLDWSN